MRVLTTIKIMFGILFLFLVPIFAYLPKSQQWEYFAIFIGGVLIGHALGDFVLKCPRCRSFVFPGSKFCGRCGENLEHGHAEWR
jgi:uncharacterized OB-fold protein